VLEDIRVSDGVVFDSIVSTSSVESVGGNVVLNEITVSNRSVNVSSHSAYPMLSPQQFKKFRLFLLSKMQAE